MVKQLGWLIAALALAAMLPARADESAALFARNKAASGGARWDALKTMETSGRLHAGGLEGRYRSVQDLVDGHARVDYELGPIEGADGYDGRSGWSRDPGGEVAVLDAPEAQRRARSDAWLAAHGYWYPSRLPARSGKVAQRTQDGHRYTVVETTPEGGDPVVLWFDTDSGLLARSAQKQDQDTATTVYSEWRKVDGLQLPYRAVTDLTDASGRTDPRRRNEIRVEQVRFDVAVDTTVFAPPAMTVTARIADAGGVTRIPFELVNNHIYVDGRIDGRPARFLVDTGGVNLLTPAAARKFGLASQGQLAARGVGEQEVDLAFAHAAELRVGGARLDRPLFYVIDLGELPAVEGVEADGLVGYEMFRRFGVTIDYAGKMLTLSNPDRFQPPVGAVAVPFEQAERIPIVTGLLEGAPARLSVDTGSRASLTLHSPFVREHGLVARYQAAPEAVVGWGVGGPNRGRPARFGTLQLGSLSISGIAGDLYTGDKGAFASPDVAGNLGGGVLKRFTVAFDYARKTMYLKPNADFDRADAFDRSGLWLLGGGDHLKVADVATDSAGARAGLHADDVITAIDGQPVKERGLPEWRLRLRELPAGTKLPIQYQRKGHAGSAELVLADRIPAVRPSSAR